MGDQDKADEESDQQESDQQEAEQASADQEKAAQKKAERAIDAILNRGVKLPPLRSVALKLLAMARLPTESIDVTKLAKLIETDSGLTAKLLRVANSAFYSTASEVTTPRHAVMVVGLTETLTMLNHYVVMESMPTFPRLEGFSHDDYSAHSWASATATKLLGRPELKVKTPPGDLYLAGLLHGVGKVVLALHREKDFTKCLKVAAVNNITLIEAEKKVLGFTHAALGARLLAKWKIPENIRAAVASYHAPHEADEEHREIAALTQVGYLIAEESGIGTSGSPTEKELEAAWIVEDGDSPLADDETLETVTTEILEALWKKSGSVLGRKGKRKAEDSDAPAPKTKTKTKTKKVAESTPKKRKTTTKKKKKKRAKKKKPQGAWNRFVAAVEDLLEG